MGSGRFPRHSACATGTCPSCGTQIKYKPMRRKKCISCDIWDYVKKLERYRRKQRR